MFEVLLSEISKKVSLSEKEQESITIFFSPKKLRKRPYLVQEGDHCKYLVFVEKGALRSYSIDDKGNENIMQFAMEGWWITDNNSFFTGVPSVYNIDALEDSEVLQLSLTAYEDMISNVPKMERYFRILMQNRLVAMQRRITISLT